MVFPTSITSAEPFPAEKLENRILYNPKALGKKKNLRAKHASIGDVKCRYLKLFKHNLCHPLSIFRCVPSWFGHKDGMF
jgi:hypothetical protein